MLYKVNFLCRFILPHSPSLLVSLKASWLSMSGWLSKSSWLSMLRLNFKCTWKDLNSRRKLDQMFERISFKLSVSGSIYANLASFGRLIMRWRKKSISSIWLMISTRLPKLIQIICMYKDLAIYKVESVFNHLQAYMSVFYPKF